MSKATTNNKSFTTDRKSSIKAKGLPDTAEEPTCSSPSSSSAAAPATSVIFDFEDAQDAPPAYSTIAHPPPASSSSSPKPQSHTSHTSSLTSAPRWKSYLWTLLLLDFFFALFAFTWTWMLWPLAIGLAILPKVNVWLLFSTAYTFRALANAELVLLDNLTGDGKPLSGYERPSSNERSESGICRSVINVLKDKTLYTTPVYFLTKVVVSICLWTMMLVVTLLACPFFCLVPWMLELAWKGMSVQRRLAYGMLGRTVEVGNRDGEATVVA